MATTKPLQLASAHTFDLGDAELYGLNAAIILSSIRRYSESSESSGYWVRFTLRNLANRHFYMSKDSVARALKLLQEHGLITVRTGPRTGRGNYTEVRLVGLDAEGCMVAERTSHYETINIETDQETSQIETIQPASTKETSHNATIQPETSQLTSQNETIIDSADALPPLSPPLVPPLPPPSHSPLLSPPIIPPTIPPNPESRTAKKNPQESEGHAESKRRLIAMVEGKNPEELMGLIAQKLLHPLQARIIIDGLENIIRRIPKFLTVEEAEKLCSKHPQELLIQMAHELDNYLENHPQRRPYTSLRATLDNWCSRRTSEFTRYRTAK